MFRLRFKRKCLNEIFANKYCTECENRPNEGGMWYE